MIYTLYSYKGGVGRSMALVNVGELFYQAGLNVLLVDWDLEAPGLERFFTLDAEKISEHPGVIDMLLDYKHQMTQDWTTDIDQFPFKKPSDLTIDLHPDSSKGRLRLLTAGQRDKANFTRYANAVLTFDWKDFYENWEGEAYFEWLRQQFLEMADIVLIDSRTGITEMGGVCTYQLGDVIVMFCGTSKQNLDGTDQMVTELKSPAVEKARGRPLEVVVVPARIDKESGVGDEFKREFLQRFARHTPTTFKSNTDYFWQLIIPYTTVCAYKEMIVTPESSVGSEDVYGAFARLAFALSRLAPGNSAIRKALPETRIKIGDTSAVGSLVGGNIVLDTNVSSDLISDTEAFHSNTPSTDPMALRQVYLNHLFTQVSPLPFSGIEPQINTGTQSLLNLSAVYTTMFTLTVKEDEQLNNSDQDHQQIESLEQKPYELSVLTQLNTHPRLVLLGDAGSGKSTFVNFLALCLAGEALGRADANIARLTEPLLIGKDNKNPQQWSHRTLLPVSVALRDFAARGLPSGEQRATASHLCNFIKMQLEKAGLGTYFPYLKEELLKQGGLLLLDGLDEVPETDHCREQIKQAVGDFAAAFPACRILVTSRTYTYRQQDWQLPGFTEAVLAPFAPDQIRYFVDHWYTYVAQVRGMIFEEAQAQAKLLKQAIFANAWLQELAACPLLLTLIVSLHVWREMSLPEKREELYANMVDLLLNRWEQLKVVRDTEGKIIMEQPSLAEWRRIDQQRVQAVLYEIAFKAHIEQRNLVGTADVPEETLVGGLLNLSQNPDMRPARLVEYLSQRAGLLIPRGTATYTFPSRTFQEYLVASYLTDHNYPEKVAALVRNDHNRWREVALIAGAKSARESDFALWALIEELCPQPLRNEEGQQLPDAWGALLAGQALAESTTLNRISDRDRPKVARVQASLVHTLETGQLSAAERATVGQVLAKIGDPRSGVGVCPDGIPDIVWCAVPAGPFIMGNITDDLTLLGKETPQCQIDLPAFQISRYPVTQAQFAAFVEHEGYSKSKYWREALQAGVWSSGKVKAWNDDQPRDRPYDFGGPFGLFNHPVVGITWYEMLAYCRWLTEQLQTWDEAPKPLAGLLQKGRWEVQLPSEAQWEKAARGADKRVYPWEGAHDPDRANYDTTGIRSTNAVGCFPKGASFYGVEELCGNVWEWTRSLYKNYPYNPADGREVLEAGGDIPRVLRGGAFFLNEEFARCTTRFMYSPLYHFSSFGFRLVLSPLT